MSAECGNRGQEGSEWRREGGRSDAQLGSAAPLRGFCTLQLCANRLGMREATGRLTTWTYDDTYQLIGEHRSSVAGGFNTTHTYDQVGNRLVRNESGSLTTSTFDAANQTVTALNSSGTTTYTFDAAGNQQIEAAPTGTKTYTWNYENQRTQVLLPSGSRETMSYNANLRNVRTET